jgi:hypothetical protein
MLSSNRKLVMPESLFPRRYSVNDEGHRVLIGLTVDETREFELLDLSSAVPENDRADSNHGRWLELYRLHQHSWEIWRAKNSEANLSRLALGHSNLGQLI